MGDWLGMSWRTRRNIPWNTHRSWSSAAVRASGWASLAGLLADGANVTIAARSADRLAAAERELGAGERLRTIVTDVSQEGQVERLFASTGPVDHIVCTAVDAVGAYQPIRRLDLTSIQKLVNAKLYGALLIAKHGTARGSITYTSGIAAYRPAAGGSVVAAVNGALGSLAAARSRSSWPRSG